MFSTSNFSKVTVAGLAAVMMMMMMLITSEAAAVSKHSKTHKRTSSDGAALETVRLQLDPGTFSPTRNIRSLQNTSISPWTYNVSHDESLFPHVLSEARCSLQGCLDSEGQEDLNLESRPIMHQVLLLRRVRPAGEESGTSYHYRLETRHIAVGCTCVRPVVKRQQ